MTQGAMTHTMTHPATPVQVPPAAPVAIRAAAVALGAYVDTMADACYAGNQMLVQECDREVTRLHRIIEGNGWTVSPGIVVLDSGERGWKVVPA